ncbi:MAG: hypothetical protein ABI607_13390 [Betaproteobacteria bacterium]
MEIDAMADFPAPQSESAGPVAPVSAGVLAYALFAIGAVLDIASRGLASPFPLMTVLAIVGVIICYVKRDEARTTWVASHFTWLIRTFWWSFLWDMIGVGLFITLIGIPFAWAIWVVTALWVIYRVVRGYLLFKDSKAIPGV